MELLSHITVLEIASGITIYLVGVVSGLLVAGKLFTRSRAGDDR